jgi:hypothetical protein
LVARCGTTGMYTVNDQNKRGVPDIIREAKVKNIRINGIDIPYERTIVYKYNDDVREVYNYLILFQM